jgi:acetaldehyde dehydrogenase/alcohol dehydrogenase
MTVLPLGRITAIFMPYSIEYTTNGGLGRYLELAKGLNFPAADEREAAPSLIAAMRDLMREISLPLSLKDAGLNREEFELLLPSIVNHADVDTNII